MSLLFAMTASYTSIPYNLLQLSIYIYKACNHKLDSSYLPSIFGSRTSCAHNTTIFCSQQNHNPYQN
jgi:hypothetical protein